MRPRPNRRRWLALVAVLLLPVTACSSDDGDGDQVESSDSADVASQLPDRAAEFVDAVFRVETEGCGWIGSGSGFAIDAHHVVTNHHVVANDSSPVVRTQSGKELRGRVIGSTARPDLAVIALDEDLPTTVSWADTNAIEPTEGLVVMGFPVPERTFKISTGEVVAFQPPNTREALIANNPIDRGNSGGPALRRDGTVAGVVTEMATRDDDGQRVAIVFTSNAVRRIAERFIASPTEVLSSCGLGPDYVPEVPTDF
ncbi:MAG: serine protease, partial [Actinomycetota bacterium]|nr:serine protease [Actinomycetota bacterium]